MAICAVRLEHCLTQTERYNRVYDVKQNFIKSKLDSNQVIQSSERTVISVLNIQDKVHRKL